MPWGWNGTKIFPNYGLPSRMAGCEPGIVKQNERLVKQHFCWNLAVYFLPVKQTCCCLLAFNNGQSTYHIEPMCKFNYESPGRVYWGIFRTEKFMGCVYKPRATIKCVVKGKRVGKLGNSYQSLKYEWSFFDCLAYLEAEQARASHTHTHTYAHA